MRHGKSNFTILKSKSFHRSRRWALAILAARTSHPRRESRDPRLEFSQSHHSPASLRALVSALAVGHWQWHPRAPLGHRTLRRTLRRSRWLAAGGTTPVYQVTLPRPLRLAPCAHIPAPALGLAQMASESLGPRFLPCCPPWLSSLSLGCATRRTDRDQPVHAHGVQVLWEARLDVRADELEAGELEEVAHVIVGADNGGVLGVE